MCILCVVRLCVQWFSGSTQLIAFDNEPDEPRCVGPVSVASDLDLKPGLSTAALGL